YRKNENGMCRASAFLCICQVQAPQEGFELPKLLNFKSIHIEKDHDGRATLNGMLAQETRVRQSFVKLAGASQCGAIDMDQRGRCQTHVIQKKGCELVLPGARGTAQQKRYPVTQQFARSLNQRVHIGALRRQSPEFLSRKLSN